MLLKDWLSLLESRDGSIRLGLDKVRVIAQDLDLINFNKPVVMIAGTNGKGSTLTAVNALAMNAGLRTAFYSSPHLIAFNERLCFDSIPATDETICASFSELD